MEMGKRNFVGMTVSQAPESTVASISVHAWALATLIAPFFSVEIMSDCVLGVLPITPWLLLCPMSTGDESSKVTLLTCSGGRMTWQPSYF